MDNPGIEPNERVLIDNYYAGTILSVERTAFGDEATVKTHTSSVPRTFLCSSLTVVRDPLLPRFALLEIDGVITFQTPEPYNPEMEIEELSYRLQGLALYRGYSINAPEGAVGHVRMSSLMEINASQFEAARRSEWAGFPVPKASRLADFGL